MTEAMTMKISDEIRKWCDGADVDGNACGELRDLADRIDSEMVELPKDADGVPIHVGDTVYLDDGRMACVTEIDFKRICEAIYCFDGSKYEAHHPSLTTHERPDSFADRRGRLRLRARAQAQARR